MKVEVDDCLSALVGQEEVNVRLIVLKQVLGEHCRTGSLTEDAEIFLPISDRRHTAVASQVHRLGVLGEQLGKAFGTGRSVERDEHGESACVMPSAVTLGGIDMDGDVHAVGGSILLAKFVDNTDPVFQLLRLCVLVRHCQHGSVRFCGAIVDIDRVAP